MLHPSLMPDGNFGRALCCPTGNATPTKPRGLAKLGFKSSAAAIIAEAYWALSPGALAFRIIPPLRQTAARQSRGKGKNKNKSRRRNCNGGVRVGPVAGPPGGFWQKQHELWRRPRIKWVYGYAGGGRLSQTLQHRDPRMLHTISPASILSDASAPANVQIGGPGIINSRV